MEALESFVADTIAENANEWYDESECGSWEDYWAECYADTEEIDEKTYNQEVFG
jgi:hypothetical protein